MAISKTIYQTFKTSRLPLLTKWHIGVLKRKNPGYDYQFFDDARLDAFIRDEYDSETYDLFSRIEIGAAKADFFRYAILYRKGGIYLDIDSLIYCRLDDFIKQGDRAIISPEGDYQNYIQYALFYEAGHPFLKRTLDYVKENIRFNRYLYNVHKMTGPTVYTRAIKDCIKEQPDIPYREVDRFYAGNVKFSYRMSKFFLYGISRKEHWKTICKTRPALKINSLNRINNL